MGEKEAGSQGAACVWRTVKQMQTREYIYTCYVRTGGVSPQVLQKRGGPNCSYVLQEKSCRTTVWLTPTMWGYKKTSTKRAANLPKDSCGREVGVRVRVKVGIGL